MLPFASTTAFWSMTSGLIKGPTGLFLSFPTKKLRDGTYWDIAYPPNAATRNMIEQAILAEYEKIVADDRQVESTKNNITREELISCGHISVILQIELGLF